VPPDTQAAKISQEQHCSLIPKRYWKNRTVTRLVGFDTSIATPVASLSILLNVIKLTKNYFADLSTFLLADRKIRNIF